MLADTAGNGMHVHLSFKQADGTNGFVASAARPANFGISANGSSFLAGVLLHLPALSAISTPASNSFRRLAPGCWAGAYQCWAVENKEAPLRVCQALTHGQPLHFELKTVDALCNPHLAIAAAIACGLDGVTRGLALPPPAQDVSEHPALPKDLGTALDALQRDEVLTAAIGEPLVKAYLAVKRRELAFFEGMSLEQECQILQRKGF